MSEQLIEHKAGFVNIIGRPNAGKSTLMNALLNDKLAIVTAKAQTTRHRIVGIWSEPHFQIVFSDTPGYLTPSYKLQQAMQQEVDTAIIDADVLLYMVDGTNPHFDPDMLSMVDLKITKVIVLVNKVDVMKEEKVKSLITDIEKQGDLIIHSVILISALEKAGLESLKDEIVGLLPNHPPYYPPDQYTDRPVRFFIAELIREQIFIQYKQEIPYSVEVVVYEFKEKETITVIKAYIFVSRKSQKPIIIGKGGIKIKHLGTAARKQMEEWLGKRVFLEMRVKIRENWKNDEQQLRNFGYLKQ